MTSRRDALRALGSFAAIPFLRNTGVEDLLDAGRRAHALAERRETSPGAHAALSAEQREIVTVAAERIIPRTETPGATDARVAHFVDVIVADWYTPAERDRLVAGLAALDAAATRTHGRSFVRCDAPQQTALLATLDRQVSELRRRDGRAADEHWFSMLKFLTIWGYYTSRVGMIDELRVELLGGRFDGDAPYVAPTSRTSSTRE